MSCELAVILEDIGQAELPSEMDLKDDGLIFGISLPHIRMLLDDIANALKITPLSSFIKEENYEDEDAEKNIEWHDPKQGLDTVQKLFFHLLANPDLDLGNSLERGAWWVLWDLRAVEIVLRAAVERNTKFYLKEC